MSKRAENAAESAKSHAVIPRNAWGEFLDAFSVRHEGWSVRLQTHDHDTGEDVLSRELPLMSIQLDLEDGKNPRINVTLGYRDRSIKHILFLPSEMVLNLSGTETDESLRIESQNTSTMVRFRLPTPRAVQE